MREPKEEDLYIRSYKREKEARFEAENLLENKTRELYFANEKLKSQIALTTELVLSTVNMVNKITSFEDDLKNYITTICKLADWPVGHVFFVSKEDPDLLVSSNLWYLKDQKYLAFQQGTAKTPLKKGVGLPGQAYSLGSHVWIADVTLDDNFPRAPYASEVGLKGGFCMPITINKKPVAFAEFFFPEVAEKENHVLQLAEIVAQQLASSLESRRIEKELRLRNSAIESCVNAIIIFNYSENYPIEYVNPAFERMTGYASSAAKGKTFFLLQTKNEEDLETLGNIRELELALKNGETYNCVIRSYRKDGSLFWNDLHIAPVREEGGNISHYVCVFNDITQNIIFKKQLEFQEKLKHQATHDTLTGLPNRTLLIDRLSQAIEEAKRFKRSMAVLFIDLDRFKNINDGLGHTAGDHVLKMVTQRLSENVRASDTLARIGGDEFVAVMPIRKRVDEVSDFIDRILLTIAIPYFFDKHEINLTCSIGLAIYPNDGNNPETLLKNADAAMYKAKEQGKNTFQSFTSEMHTKITERLALENGLRHALNNNELFLLYQPKFDVRANRIVGVEALIRWKHPTQGIVLPNDFIPIAEETGIILPISDWVLHTACRQNKKWQEDGYPPIVISVNLSGRQFRKKDFVKTVAEVLKETGLDPQYLELELTENLIMSDAPEFIAPLEELKKMGVKLSIDDFGTGYSSLSYLRQFPIDWLKIDKSFVKALNEGKDAESLIKAIISLGHSLNLRVLAEGVETIEQYKQLSSFKCDEVQGYYISYPTTSDEIVAFLSKNKS